MGERATQQRQLGIQRSPQFNATARHRPSVAVISVVIGLCFLAAAGIDDHVRAATRRQLSRPLAEAETHRSLARGRCRRGSSVWLRRTFAIGLRPTLSLTSRLILTVLAVLSNDRHWGRSGMNRCTVGKP